MPFSSPRFFVDGALRDIAYAFRAFRRAPLSALTIVTTIGIGLAAVAAVFTFLNVFIFRVDEVARPEELFAVVRPAPFGSDRVRLTRPHYDALRRETAIFTDAFAMLLDIDSRIDGRMMAGTLVTGNFFRVLGVDAVHGRALMSADDEPYGGQPVVVLSDRGWSRHFARDPAVVGRRLIVNGFSYEIVGVMPEGFRGLDVGPPDYWAPLGLVGQFRPFHSGREDVLGLDVIGRLRPGLSRETAIAGLVVWDRRRTDRTPATTPQPADLTLEPRRGTVPQPGEALLLFAPLFLAFGLILMIGCANVANLLLARAFSRQREIGVRLALGASRARLIRQLLTESLMLAIGAAALGFLLSRVVLEGAIYAVTSTIAPELAELFTLSPPAADWRVSMFLLGGAIVAAVSFGLAPALQATRLELIRTMRGEVTRDSRPRRARHALISIQVTASALLLILSAVFLRSALAASTVEPGLRTADTLMVEIINEQTRQAMVDAVVSDPAVTLTSASWPDAMGRPRMAFADVPASAEAAARKAVSRSSVAYRFVSPGYFSVLGVEVLRGRSFAPGERSADAGVAVVSESVARRLWPDAEAVGQLLHLEPDPGSETRRIDEPPLSTRSFTIVGVTRDVAGFRLAGFEEAGLHPDQRRSREDRVDRARQWRSRTGAARPSSTTDRHRPEYGTGHDDEDRRAAGDIPPAGCLLADPRARRARACADVVGTLRRPVLSRRTAHEGNRRASRARGDDGEHWTAGADGVGASGRPGYSDGQQSGCGAWNRADGDAGRVVNLRGRAHLRSGGLRREPPLYRHGMRVRRVDSCAAGGPNRPDCRPQAGLTVAVRQLHNQ
jgi:predicted permease